MKLQVNTFSQYLERSIKGTFQMSSSAWLADYPDPEDFLILLYGPNAPPGPNASAFSNPEYDKLFEQMKVMEDTPEREALIHRMVAIVVEECPWIFNFHAPSYVLRHSWYKNGKTHSISGNYAKYIRVEPDVRQAYWKVEDKPNRRVPLYALAFLVVVLAPGIVITSMRRRR
jgi:ABC-type oligopeptide transport system substrate-binding subunit